MALSPPSYGSIYTDGHSLRVVDPVPIPSFSRIAVLIRSADDFDDDASETTPELIEDASELVDGTRELIADARRLVSEAHQMVDEAEDLADESHPLLSSNDIEHNIRPRQPAFRRTCNVVTTTMCYIVFFAALTAYFGTLAFYLWTRWQAVHNAGWLCSIHAGFEYIANAYGTIFFIQLLVLLLMFLEGEGVRRIIEATVQRKVNLRFALQLLAVTLFLWDAMCQCLFFGYWTFTCEENHRG
jgi:hypothetical protein